MISSIGSIPEPIEGIEMKGELFDFSDWDLGRLDAYPTVFAAGNVATGKGNIIASRKHARAVSETIVEAFLGLGEDGHAGEEALADSRNAQSREAAEKIASRSPASRPSAANALEALRTSASASANRRSATTETSTAWIERVTPPDMA